MEDAPYLKGPDTLALLGTLAVLPGPSRFQVGPDTYHYIYTATDTTYEGFPVYRCSRGRDSLPGILYMLRFNGRWQAGIITGDEPTSGDELLRRMTPAFRAADSDDVRQEGSHRWQCWGESRQQWWPPSSFMRRLLS